MAVQSTDLLMIERAGVLHKAAVSDLPSGGGGADPGLVLVGPPQVVTAPVAAVDFDLPAEYSRFRLVVNGLTNSVGVAQTRLTLSTDGGATFISSGNHKVFTLQYAYGSTTPNITSSSAVPFMILLQNPGGATNLKQSGVFDLLSLSDVLSAQCFLDMDVYGSFISNRREMAARVNTIRISQSTNQIATGTFSLYAYKETA